MSAPPSRGAAGRRVTLVPTLLARAIADRHGVLAYVDDALAAVFVRLDDPAYEDLRGRWVLEAGFAPFEPSEAPVFETLAAAERWLAAATTATEPE